jgi:hypothetical protein
MKLPIFVSWSGARSEAVAKILCSWLPKVLHTTDPWMSSTMDVGVTWFQEIGARLSSTTFGILCLTPENWQAPWLNFEAGAIGRTLQGGRVCPYLAGGLQIAQMSGPLVNYNARAANRDGTYDLVATINAALGDMRVRDDVLSHSFETAWGTLDAQLQAIPTPKKDGKSARSGDDKLDELLDLARLVSRKLVADPLSETPRPFDPQRDTQRVLDWARAHRAANAFQLGERNFQRFLHDSNFDGGTNHALQWDENDWLVFQ